MTEEGKQAQQENEGIVIYSNCTHTSMGLQE